MIKLMECKYIGAKKVDSKVIKSPARLLEWGDKFYYHVKDCMHAGKDIANQILILRQCHG